MLLVPSMIDLEEGCNSILQVLEIEMREVKWKQIEQQKMTYLLFRSQIALQLLSYLEYTTTVCMVILVFVAKFAVLIFDFQAFKRMIGNWIIFIHHVKKAVKNSLTLEARKTTSLQLNMHLL